MNNQLLETKFNNTSLWKINRGIFVAILIISLGVTGWWLISVDDPYVQEVLSYQGNISRGEAIFQINCAGCHGINGAGNVGPSLINISKRKSDSQIITQVISGKTPPMPEFQPSAEDMADLLQYLKNK